MADERPLSSREVEAAAQQYGQPGIKNYGARSINVERFPLVSTLAVSLRVLGFLVVAVGGVIFVKHFLPWLACSQRPGFGAKSVCTFPLWESGISGTVLVFGLVIVAAGEMLGMFRSIEGNTFKLLQVTQEADYKNRLAQP